ncbi:basic proline-rich protein-like [Penaeus monodon]|uniref:basic proline-rich protein-like n=1 Tax=Penaeus monodon TaxID=6687 RepID=UPI0018A784A0|nr:basic proline-rich protein-like [Penaeus monodon]
MSVSLLHSPPEGTPPRSPKPPLLSPGGTPPRSPKPPLLSPGGTPPRSPKPPLLSPGGTPPASIPRGSPGTPADHPGTPASIPRGYAPRFCPPGVRHLDHPTPQLLSPGVRLQSRPKPLLLFPWGTPPRSPKAAASIPRGYASVHPHPLHPRGTTLSPNPLLLSPGDTPLVSKPRYSPGVHLLGRPKPLHYAPPGYAS